MDQKPESEETVAESWNEELQSISAGHANEAIRSVRQEVLCDGALNLKVQLSANDGRQDAEVYGGISKLPQAVIVNVCLIIN